MLGNCEIDQVSLMFISEYANTWDARQILQIFFFNNKNKIFCDSQSLFIELCIPLLEYLFEEMYAWVRVHFPEHQPVTEPQAKTTRKKVQRKSKAFFLWYG